MYGVQGYQPDITHCKDYPENTKLTSKMEEELEEEQFSFRRCNWIHSNNLRKMYRKR